ncbi:MAG: Glucose-1-phosphate adenylyltransferase [bacterium ADurb.Bin429]|nr:MAG: Glucose-1-phosphate adenylyltransferase [bacterium ADurb.Bin429]
MIDPRRVYALILGGGAGTRLFPLTKDRAKPAVPFVGKYRLVDVPISNCLNSGMAHIFVLTQFNSHSLHRHIQQSYRLDFTTNGFVDILAAEQSPRNTTWYQGTADAVRRNLWHLNDPAFTHALILSGDQLYRMDFRDIFETHRGRNADVTISVTPKRPEEAGGFGVMKVDEHLRVVDFVEKPSPEQIADLVVPGESLAPMGIQINGPVVLASMGIYVFSLPNLHRALSNDMDDFGKHVIPLCVRTLRVYAHPFVGYWEDVGTIRTFFQANLDMTSWTPPFEFYDELQPVFTHPRFLPNNKLDEVEVIHSIISEGCFIRQAKISHSVTGVRAAVRRGSALHQVVMLGQDAYGQACQACGPSAQLPLVDEDDEVCGQDAPSRGIGRHCQITRAIIDKNVCIGDHVVITDHTGKPDEDGNGYYVRDGIVIIPKHTVIPSWSVI